MIAPDNPTTIRDKMIALIAEEGRTNPDKDYAKKLYNEIFNTLDHVPEDFEAYMSFVLPIIQAKREELKSSPFAAKSEPQLGEL